MAEAQRALEGIAGPLATRAGIEVPLHLSADLRTDLALQM
jgi:hypothetical protein